MLISRERVTARMLGNHQKVNFTQRISSKMSISGQKGLKVDFTLTRHSKNVRD